MSKTTVDWSTLEGGRIADLPPPALAFEPEVDKETARVESLITAHDVMKSKVGVKLLEFASNSHLEDYYIRNMAMLAMFDHCGVLDAYFTGADIRTYMTVFHETDYGWALRLRRPTGTGLFRIVYNEDVVTHVGRQTVHYNAVP